MAVSLKFTEHSHKYGYSDAGKNNFCKSLRPGKTVKREEVVEDKYNGNLENNLSEYCENKCFFAHTAGLENAHCHKVHTDKRQTYAHTPKKL